MSREGCSIKKIARTVGAGERHVRPFLKRHGADREFVTYRTGKDNHEWMGGRTTDKNGYVLVLARNHPNARKNGYILEHRLIMSQYLGRALSKMEVVHHANGIRDDNRIENLILFEKNADHLRHELAGQCPKWTKDGLARLRESNRRIGDQRRGKKLQWSTKPSARQSL
jgi:hypothetical protein